MNQQSFSPFPLRYPLFKRNDVALEGVYTNLGDLFDSADELLNTRDRYNLLRVAWEFDKFLRAALGVDYFDTAQFPLDSSDSAHALAVEQMDELLKTLRDWYAGTVVQAADVLRKNDN